MPEPEKTEIDTEAKDGSRLTLGETDFHVFHTPGHTPGSVSLWIPAESTLVAGDTLFKDSIGRTDLPGGDGRQILRSIKEKILTLPDDATVIAGHGPNTTIERERKRNPFLRGI
jgi:glyoxylase-like metal-dependent hydrolase (beta-lactamase superfamily II)